MKKLTELLRELIARADDGDGIPRADHDAIRRIIARQRAVIRKTNAKIAAIAKQRQKKAKKKH